MKKSHEKYKIKNFFNRKKVRKLFRFKNLLIVTLVITIILMVLYSKSIGFGKGNGVDGDKENSKIEVNGDNNLAIEVLEKTVILTIEPTQQPQIIEEKKSVDVFEEAILAITVVGNDYFYNNERILLEDFIVIIQEIEGKVIVEIKDDNASLRAYNNLLNELDKINIECKVEQ